MRWFESSWPSCSVAFFIEGSAFLHPFCANLETGEVDMVSFATYSMIVSLMMLFPLLIGAFTAGPMMNKFLEKAQTAVSTALVSIILIAIGYQVDSVTGDYVGDLANMPTMLTWFIVIMCLFFFERKAFAVRLLTFRLLACLRHIWLKHHFMSKELKGKDGSKDGFDIYKRFVVLCRGKCDFFRHRIGTRLHMSNAFKKEDPKDDSKDNSFDKASEKFCICRSRAIGEK